MRSTERKLIGTVIRDPLHVLGIALLVIVAAAAGCGSGGGGMSPAALLDTIGIDKGICVILGDRDGETAVGVAEGSGLTVFLQYPDRRQAETARKRVFESGYLGSRIIVDTGDLGHINLADNIADACVVLDTSLGVPGEELLRVVNPLGKAVIGGRELTKPFPDGADDWSHPYHGPDNNPQSEDTLAKAPYLTQFLAGPYYAPMPQVTVASAGRVFRALGHIAFKPREEKYLNTLMACNGYNGTILWTRDLVPGIMVHRNTMIATPDILYLGDDTSCKLIDTVTGDVVDEIAPPEGEVGGTFWKWMALENGVLYAMIGEQEMKDPEVRNSWDNHGWPWNPLSKGFNLPENVWGYGKTISAIDPETKNILWTHREEEPIDSRSVCMKNGRLFAFRFGSFLTCLDAKTGAVLWKKTAAGDPDLFRAIGENLNRQDWRTNWRTTAYLTCSDQALYFAGPMFDKLIVLSAEDGSVMWRHPYDNFQLVLRDDGLYGIGGPWSSKVSRKFDPITGEVLGEFEIGRRACTRPTGSPDAIFFRANGGSIRFDVASLKPQYVSPMRPPCFDGVTVANGYLYWWPSVCDCQLSIYGATCLGPAGDFDFTAPDDAGRLEKFSDNPSEAAAFALSPDDWPTFRADNGCRAQSGAVIPETAVRLWEYRPAHPSKPTPPIAAGGCVFVAGSDGTVTSIDASSGRESWRAFTGGGIRIAPTVWNGRVFVGSGDGWMYVLDAGSGNDLWRFRAAPVERKIPVYGTILSTWPAASGVLVDDGVAYVAAGIANYDGTYVYALDAESGDVIWRNTGSGHMNAGATTGAGVQGHLLLHDGILYMAGGNAVSPAAYDARTGQCLNNGDLLDIGESVCLRGWELYLVGDKVAVGGQPFYRDPEYPVMDPTVQQKLFHASTGERDIVWENSSRLYCYNPIDRTVLSNSVFQRAYPGHHIIKPWGRLDVTADPLWEKECEGSAGVAVCANAVVVIDAASVKAIRLADGELLWEQRLTGSPVPWGVAVDSEGRVLVSMEDGRVVCFGGKS